MRYQFETEGPIREIVHPDICQQAAFRLDRPLHSTKEDIFELEDGQWFMLIGGERVILEGRWVLPKIVNRPEKPNPSRSVMVNVRD